MSGSKKVDRARNPKVRADGEGTLFRIQTSYGTAWRAEVTLGYTAAGKRVVATGTGPNRAMATQRREANRLKKLVSLGELPPTALPQTFLGTGSENFEEYAKAWLERLKSEPGISAETRRSYSHRTRNHLIPHLGSRPIGSISPKDIRELFWEVLPNSLASQGRKGKKETNLTPGSLNNTWIAARQIFKAAVTDGTIASHPMQGIKRPVMRPPEVHVDMGATLKILASLSGSRDLAMWLTSMVLGLRMSELTGLTWDRVHLDASPPHVEIRQQLSWEGSEHGCGGTCGVDARLCPKRIAGRGHFIKPLTKTRAGHRKLPLPIRLQEAFRELKEVRDAVREAGELEWEDHDSDSETQGPILRHLTWNPLPGEGLGNLVFMWDDATPISQGRYSGLWKRVCKNAGVPTHRAHINRHTTATILAESGYSSDVARLILGHASPEMTLYYTHMNTLKTAAPALEAVANKLAIPDFDAARLEETPDDE